MKKLAITFSVTAAICSAMLMNTNSAQAYIPLGELLASAPCPIEQPCNQTKALMAKCPKDNYPKAECPKKECETPQVFDSCAEIQDWKIKYFEKRCKVYTQLGLSQEQRVQAKTIDERFFDEIAPLKICCKQEKAKLKDMECKKCSWCEKREQKQKIKDLKSEIKDKKKQHQKCFEKILNDCQKQTYKKIKDKDCGC